MTEATNCCRNCRYSVMEINADRGTCNRHAPTPKFDTAWATWPSIWGLNWCGEWTPIPADDPVTQAEQSLADFLAHSDSIPGFYPEQSPEPTVPVVITYDHPYEDPLR